MISQNEISNEMKVKKKLEDVSFDKILHRVKKLAKEADEVKFCRINENYRSIMMV